MFFYNVATGIFSALGDSKRRLSSWPRPRRATSSWISCLSPRLRWALRAWRGRRSSAKGVSCVLAVLFVLRRLRGVETDEKSALFSFPLFCRIAVIAVPSILQQSFISVGNIVIQGVINSFGSGRDGGLFRIRQAQQPRDYLADDAGQRHIQLHGAEHRREQNGARAQRLQGRAETRVGCSACRLSRCICSAGGCW